MFWWHSRTNSVWNNCPSIWLVDVNNSVLVAQGCIPPLCDLLTVQDPKIVTVALEGLENVLRVGSMDAEKTGSGQNHYAYMVEEAGGVDKLESLEKHSNIEIYKKAVDIVDQYFGEEDDETEQSIAPQATAQQYAFGLQPMQQQQQYQFQ